MKKIGILTFHFTTNYGGVIQAYSLYNKIIELGYEVEIINFIPKYYQNRKTRHIIGLTKNVFKNNYFNIISKYLIFKKTNNNVETKFDLFRQKNLKLSRLVDEDSLEDILNDYSKIIVGSDQLWTPSERKNKEYFLDFNSYKNEKYTYAIDSSNSEASQNDIINLRKSMNDFDDISVRNEHTFVFVKKIIKKEPTIVLDPTMLLDESYFILEKNKVEEDYILIYVLGEEINGGNSRLINLVKKKYPGLKTYAVYTYTSKMNFNKNVDKVIYDAGPVEWLNLIRNSKFVITDSFHGVLFSLKFKVPFISYYSEKIREARFFDLAKRFNIGDFIINEIDENKILEILDKKINYEELEIIIEKNKTISLEYLNKILKD